jgi:hypothetical protein
MKTGVIRQKSLQPASNLVLHERFPKGWIKKPKQNWRDEIAKRGPHLSLSEAEYLMELRW